jgi:hypothetical protein
MFVRKSSVGMVPKCILSEVAGHTGLLCSWFREKTPPPFSGYLGERPQF